MCRILFFRKRSVGTLNRKILGIHLISVCIRVALNMQTVFLTIFIYEPAHRNAEHPEVSHNRHIFQHTGRQHFPVQPGPSLNFRIHGLGKIKKQAA